MFSPSFFPFSSLSNADLFLNFHSPLNSLDVDHELRKALTDSLSDDIVESFEFKYYTPSQLDYLAAKYSSSIQLSIFHVNIRSLNANHNKLITFLLCLNFNFDILILSEIWSTNLSYFLNLLPNYDFFYDSPSARAGGVGIYVKKSLNATQTAKYNYSLPSHVVRNYESVWIEIGKGKNTIVVGGFYRHPNTSIKKFSEEFLFSLDKLKNVKYCYLFGDINICLSNYSNNANTTEFVDSILDAKFLPYVYLPTRFTNHSSSIIDHVYSNDLFVGKRGCKTGLILNDIADHCANFMLILEQHESTSIVSSPLPLQQFRNFSKRNTENFISYLSSSDWNHVYSCSDPNIALDHFVDTFTYYHDLCFPFTTTKIKTRPDKKWVSPILIKSINLKSKLYKKWIKSKKTCDESRYKNHAKILRKDLLAAEKQYYSQLFDTKVNNNKAIWRNINSLINYKQPKISAISYIVDNGVTIDQPYQMSTIFNNYFVDIGKSLNDSTSPKVGIAPFETYLGPPKSKSFYCSKVTLSELCDVINKLKPSRSCISDCISSSLLKACNIHIAHPLLFIINLSFDTGIFPDRLKTSKVTPIFKKGVKCNVSNYRPISVTNPLSKILERLMATRMINFIDKFKILYDFQFDFRKNYSTSIAVLDLVNMIQKETFEGNYVLGIFMDFQKAFDTVNFAILLKKTLPLWLQGPQP